MIRCAITDGSHPPTSSARRTGLLAAAQRWAALGVDFVQLREKSLDAGELVALAREMLAIFAAAAPDTNRRTRLLSGRTQLLINGRPDIAAATNADGVHLSTRQGELTPAQVRAVFAASELPKPVVSISCHTLAEVRRAAAAGADLILFGPVFEKRVAGEVVVEGVGLAALQAACAIAGETPLLALGGVTADNTAMCLDAGAAGVAGIRLFGTKLDL